MFAKAGNAIGKHAAERARGDGEGSADEKGPDEGSVEALRAVGDVLQSVCKAFDEVDGALLVAVVIGYKTTQVDTSSEAENCGHVLGKLFWTDDTCAGVGLLETCAWFSMVKLLSEGCDVTAKRHAVNATFEF